MRSLEFISIPLYHGTDIKLGLNILADNYIRGSKTPNDQIVGVSMTRDKNLWFHGVQKDAAMILFVFDRNQLKTRFKVIPFDYFNPDVYHSDQYRRRESEEIVITDRLSLRFLSYIIADDAIWPEEREELETLAEMNNVKIEFVDRIIREDREDKDTLELPDLKVGDEIKIGRWKNRKAIIKGFKKDKNNHPIMKTNKGDQQVFKARISKLIPKKDLTEGKVLSFDHGKVIQNPTLQQLKNLIKTKKDDSLRVLLTKTDFYIWDAWNLTHQGVKVDLIHDYGYEYNDYKHEMIHLDNRIKSTAIPSYNERYTKLIKQLKNSKLFEFKIEKVYTDDPHLPEIKVAVNPNWGTLRNLIKRTDSKELRSYYFDKKFYFWDADLIIHKPMADLLGIPFEDKNRLLLRIDWEEDTDDFKLYYREEMYSVYTNNSYVKRNFTIDKEFLILKDVKKQLKEFKMEKVYDDYHNVEIKVAVNPNWQTLRNLLARSEYNELRAYYSNERFYFWDANELIHSPMAKLLGLPYNDKNRLDLRIMGNDEVVLDHSDEMADIYKQIPYIDRNFDVKNHGWEYLVLKGSIQ